VTVYVPRGWGLLTCISTLFTLLTFFIWTKAKKDAQWGMLKYKKIRISK
jgi:hypothetical protein